MAQYDEDELFKQLARAKEQQVTNKQLPDRQIGETSAETHPLFDAYVQFVAHCRSLKPGPQFPLNLHRPHFCDQSCQWIVFGDYAFCSRSGNLHRCDIVRCRERKQCDGFDVCIFTGKLYGLHYEVDDTDPAGDGDHMTREIDKNKAPKTYGPKPKRVKQKVGIKGRKLSAQTIQKQNNQDLLIADAGKVLRALLIRDENVPIPESFYFAFSVVAVAIWHKIKPHCEQVKRALKYDFKYHCLVLLYLMRNTFKTRDLVLFRGQLFLEAALPDMKFLTKIKLGDRTINQGWQTRTNKQFLQGIRNLSKIDAIELARKALEVNL